MRFQNNIFLEGKATFDGEKFGTDDLASIYKLNKQYSNQKSHLVAPAGIEPAFAP
jgi:hypothetical protein